MGYNKLIESLRRQGNEKIRKIWDDAGAGAEKIRAEASRDIALIEARYRKRISEEVKAQERGILSEAEKNARVIKLSAEKVLSGRVFSLALLCLNELRDENYGVIFEDLVKELPHARWEDVRVNAEDVQIARKYFAGAKIITDNSISCGFEVFLEKGKIHISNTFEKRLEKAWHDILPLLIRDIYKEVQSNGN